MPINDYRKQVGTAVEAGDEPPSILRFLSDQANSPEQEKRRLEEARNQDRYRWLCNAAVNSYEHGEMTFEACVRMLANMAKRAKVAGGVRNALIGEAVMLVCCATPKKSAKRGRKALPIWLIEGIVAGGKHYAGRPLRGGRESKKRQQCIATRVAEDLNSWGISSVTPNTVEEVLRSKAAG